ncbi:hypothetical protein C7B65_15115 [Phormidesmis priestleyi ULC007]|uniref:Uncharacterized protein n=1 Tax=Phormidesmis priestleyi ULC007 TaxID=1920490 RepID=A0A2T1DD24_9CYAN|nr:hypothetical protein [Phormidesmis priestleyi]PSB18422.1 hypothetical protein C7B65_15115 [Phormidesmis priestleyi ULC007]PZO48851.1 MAG: hypothetical protein DCF14_16075 [Phormidesmis priestleyi]
MKTVTSNSTRFSFIPEPDDKFLKLFSHRHDYIWANSQAIWQTESRHPLSDRLINQQSYLYGVRFGAETNYMMIDLDTGGLYHPARDPFARDRILEALEPLGLVAHIAITSSYSGGIHLYFPFEQPQKTWRVALAVKVALENAGFTIAQGHLEVFPNSKPYDADAPTLYQAHRLPLQIGSYLLNRDGETCYPSKTEFVSQWKFCQKRSDVTTAALDKVIALARIDQPRLTGKASKFLNDLNADIETGWTGHGQTNFLLGRIAMRSYIFEQMDGAELIAHIVTTAKLLPGYRDWCRHQHEIADRAAHWARSITSSTRYFPYGSTPTNTNPIPEMNWSQQQSDQARERIQAAIASMLNASTLPAQITARFTALKAAGIGSSTLYRHRDLWHPDFLRLEIISETRSGGLFEECESEFLEKLEDVEKGDQSEKCPTSLLGGTPGNTPHSQRFSDSYTPKIVETEGIDATARLSDDLGCNGRQNDD